LIDDEEGRLHITRANNGQEEETFPLSMNSCIF